jgi:hypothetical protein
MAGAGTIGNVSATALLNYFFKQAPYLHLSDMWIGLSTSTPNDDGTGVTEPNVNNYSRVQVDADNWNDAVNSVIKNNGPVSFPTASGSWGTITYFVLYDAETAGNFLGSGQLGASQAVGLNDILQFADQQIEITLA